MRVQVGDVRLFFDVEGAKLVPDGPAMREKPTLLLLHGGPGLDHSLFKPHTAAALADLCQLVYLDHRGHGRSDRGDPARWTLEQWGDDVRAFCDALGIERPIVLGASFGGLVAQSYAARHPDHPSKLILLSTAARMNVVERKLAAFERKGGPEAREVARHTFTEPPTPELGEAFRRVCLPLYVRQTPALLAEQAETMARVVRNDAVPMAFVPVMNATDLRPLLTRVACPTLVVGGAEDPMIPPADMEELAAALVNAPVRYESIPDAGHGCADARDALFRAIRAFIATP